MPKRMNSRVYPMLPVLFFVVAIGLVLWLGWPTAESPIKQDRIFVVTTIYPLADFTQNVGGELVYVSNVIPAGAEPHDYEPSPREVAQVIEADVLIYLGGGLDTWAEDLAEETRGNGGQVLGIEDHVPFTKVEEGHQEESEHEEDEHDHEGTDPHIWLDPVEAQDIVAAIRDVLIEADPAHAAQYQSNADDYIQSLMELHDSYSISLTACELNDIIVSHDAFGYLARRYGFNTHAIAGLSPEAEPSVQDLAELAEEARELGVKTIFFETLVSPKLAETLAQEIGAMTAVLNPLEGLDEEELQAGDTYLTVMEKNREALSSAMLCQ